MLSGHSRWPRLTLVPFLFAPINHTSSVCILHLNRDDDDEDHDDDDDDDEDHYDDDDGGDNALVSVYIYHF